jgi:BMFP domain-containing protein YqiC
MAQSVDVKRLLATGKQFTDSGRSQARQLGTDLVTQGRRATEQISAAIDELAGRASRERIEELRRAVRDEVQRELRTLRESMNADLAKVKASVDRIAAVVDDLGSQHRAHTEELRGAVRDEVHRQLSTFDFATKEDLVALGCSLRDDLTVLESRVQQGAESSTGGSEANARQDTTLRVPPPHQNPSTP